MPVTEITSTARFDSYLLPETLDPKSSHTNQYVFVDFYADWCGPCKRFAPTLEKLSEQYTSVIFLKVNCDECQEVADRYKIRSLPTFHMFKVGSTEPTISPIQGADTTKVEGALKAVSEQIAPGEEF